MDLFFFTSYFLFSYHHQSLSNGLSINRVEYENFDKIIFNVLIYITSLFNQYHKIGNAILNRKCLNDKQNHENGFFK